MVRIVFTVILLLVSVIPAAAQQALTNRQRVADMNQVSSFYAKNYAPYEWKRAVFGFDLFNLAPWQSRIRDLDDLDFQELLIEYVASLNDAHDYIAFPTTFSASLGLSVDIYDGKVLIDAINRTALPFADYSFTIGDQLISVDGVPVERLLRQFEKYAISANPRSTSRIAATRIVSRSQQIMPHTSSLGDYAEVVVYRFAAGMANTFSMPWLKNGIPLNSQGPVPSPRPGRSLRRLQSAFGVSQVSDNDSAPSLFQLTAASDNTMPSYMQSMAPLMNVSVPTEYYGVLNFGSRFPIYGPPPGFVIRLGPSANDFFLSGTYVANGMRIGLIRIPSMSPPNTALALQQLDQEIAYFNANTDALVIDVMRNPGGLVSFVESISQRFIPAPFRTMGFEIRATASWLFSFAAQLTNAINANAPAQIIENLRRNYEEVERAYNEQRGRSAPVSLNSTGSLILAPLPTAYNKPLMVLTDEFTASGGDMFAAIIQDNHRGPLFGVRTMGAGGSVVGFNAAAYTEAFFRVTVSLMSRAAPMDTRGFPASPYVENVGVRPDIPLDYMTRENLLNGGLAFVQAFTNAIVSHAQSTTN
jgi:hypothetical protein